jgi:hypothetical protein
MEKLRTFDFRSSLFAMGKWASGFQEVRQPRLTVSSGSPVSALQVRKTSRMQMSGPVASTVAFAIVVWNWDSNARETVFAADTVD